MKAYKLTNKDGQSHGGCQWGENVTHKTDGNGELCGPGWLHFYDDPYLAVIFNPIHADFSNPKLWEAEATGAIKKDNGLKFGTTELTTIKEIPLPEITITQKIKFAILCAKEVYANPTWNKWADNWLSGKDRSAESAARVVGVVWAISEESVASAESAAMAARAISEESVASAASAASVGWAASVASVESAESAEWAASVANLDFKIIIRKAINHKGEYE